MEGGSDAQRVQPCEERHVEARRRRVNEQRPVGQPLGRLQSYFEALFRNWTALYLNV